MLVKLENPNFVSLKSYKNQMRKKKKRYSPHFSALDRSATTLAKIKRGLGAVPQCQNPNLPFLHTYHKMVIILAIELGFKQLFLH